MSDVISASVLIEHPEQLSKLSPPAILGVFGDPVAHSLSPEFHNPALSAAAINGQYVRIHAPAELFDQALRALPEAGFRGANITIPHKAAALATVDEADEEARRAGGVNTVTLDGRRLLGFSTDGPGLSRAIREEFSVDLKDLRVLLLGAGGGAGRAAAARCASEGCERLVLANRSVDKVRTLAASLAAAFRTDRLVGPADRLMAIPMEPAALRDQIDQVDLVINATPLGMRLTDPSPLPTPLLTPNLMVYDMVYSGGKSRLILDAEAAGARAANGLSMLLHQGALSFEIWFNRPAPIEVMRTALLSAAARNRESGIFFAAPGECLHENPV
ncbi:MAG: shikimate dehydrogenase [Terrimicrobiaceae bacterium]